MMVGASKKKKRKKGVVVMVAGPVRLVVNCFALVDEQWWNSLPWESYPGKHCHLTHEQK
jgi:hypothetical protein